MRLVAKLWSKATWSVGSIAVFALLTIFVGLGSFGLWEPNEVAVVADAHKSAPAAAMIRGAREQANEAIKARKVKKPAKPVAKERDQAERKDCPQSELKPALGDELTVRSHQALGGELGGRLPNALFGFVIVLCCWLFGRLFGTPRAGLFSAAIALTFPAIILGSRSMTGDMLSMLCATVVILSAAVVMWPPQGRRSWVQFVASIGVGLGLVVGYRASGMLLGVVAPAGAVAMAGLAYSSSALAAWWKKSELTRDRVRVGALTVVFGLVAITALVVFIREVFDVADAGADDRQLLGLTLAPCTGKTQAALGAWQPKGDTEINFHALVELIGFGAFPFAALAPIALGRLAFWRELDRRTLLGYLLLAWAALTWIVAGVVERKISPVLFPALPALAIAVGVWLDDSWPDRDDKSATRTPLLGLFVALAAAVLAKDLKSFPEKLTGVHLAGAEYDFPEASLLPKLVLLFGVLFAVAAFVGIALYRHDGAKERWYQRATRFGLPAALVIALLFSLFVSQGWTRQLATKLSSRRTFDVLAELKKPGEKLGVLGRLGQGPKHYAGDDFVDLPNRAELYKFLASEERVFALMPVGDLCTVHAAKATQGFEYFVLDDQNTKHLLVSNELGSGATDKNHIAEYIVRERPKDIGKPISVDYDGKLELIGVKYPESVGRGDRFEITLFFEVKQKLRRNWNIFLHFDGFGQRFQGDHKPAEVFCATTQWSPGDFIVDTVELEAGGLTYPKGKYQILAGLFTGTNPNWTNMKIKTKGADKADRFPIGVIEVR